MRKLLKSKGTLIIFIAISVYVIMVDINLQQRTHLLQDHKLLFRDLITVDLGDGNCDIGNPTEDGGESSVDAVRSLLVSYPGSGKRFTWTVIKALTNEEVADDWNFSGKLDVNGTNVSKPLCVKTSWPHKEGIWSWNTMMDQVILLVRNPRHAIPSYHNMRFELDYSQNWAESYLHIPSTYKERPAVDKWVEWREAHFEVEILKWVEFIDFWLMGGYVESTGDIHDRCLTMEIDCIPKAIIDFDALYQREAESNEEFIKLYEVLEGSANVEVVSSQIRACVLESVYDWNALHQGGRPNPDLTVEYRFTIGQHDIMLTRLKSLRNKYDGTDNGSDSTSTPTRSPNPKLVSILNNYILRNEGERLVEVTNVLLRNMVEDLFGNENCDGLLAGTELMVCSYTKIVDNHDVILSESTGDFPFPYEEYLKERADLVRFYMNSNGSSTWSQNSGWMGKGDHCNWFGVSCTVEHRVHSIVLPNNNIAGDFPSDLESIYMLETLNLSMNSLDGIIPEEVCNKLGLNITADAANCDNIFDSSTSLYGSGCCDEVIGQ